MIVGIIILQTSIIAPTLFKKLEIHEFGIVIRALWPKFFVILTILGVTTLISLYFEQDSTITHYAIAGATTLFAFICYIIIPTTNKATDEGNEKLFNLLHKTSVYLTIIILLLNISYIFV